MLLHVATGTAPVDPALRLLAAEAAAAAFGSEARPPNKAAAIYSYSDMPLGVVVTGVLAALLSLLILLLLLPPVPPEVMLDELFPGVDDASGMGDCAGDGGGGIFRPQTVLTPLELSN